MHENQPKGILPKQSGSRLTIGYVGRFLTDKNSYTVWQGVMDTARERGVNLISFFPHELEASSGFDAQANVLYDLVSADRLDGLVIWTAPLMNYAGPAGAKRILDRYRPLPIVTIERGTTDDIPWLEIDSYQSMREGVIHLTREHGYRRIAFIRGPDTTHTGARERYQAYLDVLAECGLPFDPALVSPPTEGQWGPEVGEEAIALLIDQRRASFEAVVGANDNFAIGAMQALQTRGIHIPGQVAVIGFDDQAGSNSVIPPLTTLSLQGYEQGQQATEMLLTLLEGGQVPQQAHLSPKLIIRQSCGCPNPAVAQAAMDAPTVTGKPRKTVRTIQDERILSEMRQAAGTVIEGLDSDWAEQLLKAFLAELETDTPGVFLPALDGVLQHVITAGGQVAAWANVISALRRNALPYLGQNLALRRAEGLWLQAQVMVGETAQQAQRYQAMQVEQQTQILNEIRATLITTFDVKDLMDTLAQDLSRLGFPACYLSLYENPRQPTETSRLMLAYDERRGRLEPQARNQVFPSQRLVPDGVLPQDRPFSLVAEALYFREDQLGLVLFEVGPRDGPIYDTLQREISSALQGALLVRRVEERSAELARQKYVLDTFMENIPDSIYFKDLASQFTRINKALALHFGLSDPAEGIGKSDSDFFPAEQARPKYEQEREIIRTGQPVLNLEEPDGIGHWALTTKMPLRDEHGQIIGTFGISRDITALKQAEAEIRALNKRLQAENLRMEAELDVTRRLQQMLLPTEDELHQIEGLDIAGFMQPADEVGGDYYDVLQHNGALKIGIGDVTGHGLESGVVMLMLQTAVRTLQTSGVEDPVYFLDILNRLLRANLQRMNVDKSMTLALLDYEMGWLHLSGQHEQLIVVRRGGKVELIDTMDLGFPLGIESGITRFMREVPPVELKTGDGVVLYSDGITEAENEAKEFYGLERLCKVVNAHWDEPAEAIKDAAVADVREFIGQQKIYDDLTLLVVKQK